MTFSPGTSESTRLGGWQEIGTFGIGQYDNRRPLRSLPIKKKKKKKCRAFK